MTETNVKPTTSNVTKATPAKVAKASVKDTETKKVSDKFAVIKTGGKQYVVEAGRFYNFEKLEGEEGSKIDFKDIFLVAEGDDIKVGKPIVEGAKVSGKILSQFKDDTVRVFKYKKRKRTRSTYGHRQPLTKVEITEIK
jgi:large subunit ribosomal protein L21